MATYRSRCASCNVRRNRQTHNHAHIYNTKRWRILRRRVLYEQPICACGCGRVATDVHHKVAIEDGGPIWDRANLEALSHECHSRLTRAEMEAR